MTIVGDDGVFGRSPRPGAPHESHCALLVRSQQPDRYLATLFAPAAAREALFALYAFDHEIGKVPHLVSEPMAGLIRLQWWRDVLVAAEAPAHPVAQALHRALAAHAIRRSGLEVAIDAREREVEAPPPADLGALERHLDMTSGAILQAALETLGATDEPARAAARRIAVVVGLAELLRALPAALAQGRPLLPAAELARHGADLDAMAEADAAPDLATSLDPVIALLAAHGVAKLQSARALRREVPRAALPVLLTGSLAGAYLRRLGRARHELLARTRERRPALAPLALLWRHMMGRF